MITQEEMQGGLDYEIWMFKETCKILSPGIQKSEFWHNLLIESLALHTRVLIDFFYCDNKKYDDIIAQDLLSTNINWKELRPPLSKILEEVKFKTNKQLKHLSKERMILENKGKKGWRIIEIFIEMDKIIDLFKNIKTTNH